MVKLPDLGKKQLCTPGELIKTIDLKLGFLILNQPKECDARGTKFHYASCDRMVTHYQMFYQASPEKPLGTFNAQNYYLYDTFEDIMVDFPGAIPCSLCNPKPSPKKTY